MAKEILLYGRFGSYSSEYFIDSVNELSDTDTLITRINSGGGDVLAAYGMIAKYQEFKGEKLIKVDGEASSMALMFCAYANRVECLDVSEFMMHRAAYPKWYENSEDFTEANRESLKAMNANLRKAIEAKIDVPKFEKLKGVTLDDVFSMDGRLDVNLTADEAKAIGLVDKINVITPSIAAEIEANNIRIAAYNSPKKVAAKEEPTIKTNKSEIMNINELKTQHPALYAEAVKDGVTAERDRVNSYLVFADVDVEAVKIGIESGENLTAKASAEFARKMFSKEKVADAEADSTKEIETKKEKPELTAEAEKLQKFNEELDKNLKTK